MEVNRVTNLEQAVKGGHALGQSALEIGGIKVFHWHVAEGETCLCRCLSFLLNSALPKIFAGLEAKNRGDLQRFQSYEIFIIAEIWADIQVGQDAIASHGWWIRRYRIKERFEDSP
jgi:hypothetical protein